MISSTLSETNPVRSSALESLLVDLGSQIRPAASQEVAERPRFCPTGLSTLDARLGGGFPCGRLSEICGPPSSGRTSLAHALLAKTLERGLLVAWIDLADAFDPISAGASAALLGSDLKRLLWVRARSEDEALRSCDRLLKTEGFELVVFDLATIPRPPFARSTPRNSGPSPRRVQKKTGALHDTSWLRLARLASSTRTSLVALSNISTTGSRAELVLEMKPLAAHFTGPPQLLDSLETTATLRRYRSRPTGETIPLRLHAEEPSHDLRPDPSPKRTR